MIRLESLDYKIEIHDDICEYIYQINIFYPCGALFETHAVYKFSDVATFLGACEKWFKKTDRANHKCTHELCSKN